MPPPYRFEREWNEGGGLGTLEEPMGPAETLAPMDDRVLIVEDDHDIREAFSVLLADEGYRVAAARDGLDALGQLRRGNSPSLILLDLMMPIMDGYEFRARQMRDERLSRIPVVVMTADRRVEQRAPQLGRVAHILRKPVDTEELLTLVRRYCPGSGGIAEA